MVKGSAASRCYAQQTRHIMNTFTRIVSLLALMLAATTAAQTPRPAGLERVRVKKQDLPLYPQEMVQLGVREGQVCIAFSIDTTGRVDDCLAVAYTHPEFAEVALAAVRRWTFEPARLQGEPIATATEVTFNFEVQGTVVVSMTAGDAYAAWVSKLAGFHESFYPRSLRELDRIPTPITALAPAYSRTLATQGHTGDVTVNFYIDQKGNVRMPAVDSSSDADLAALAVTALHQWKFEPPTCKGLPVLVKATQMFRFRPDDKTAPRVSNNG